SDPTRHPRASGEGGGLGHRAGRALRDEPAGRLEAPEGAGARRTGLEGSGAAVAARAAPGDPDQGGRRVDRPVPPLLGRALRPTGRVPGRAPGTWTKHEEGRGRWAETVGTSTRW